MKSSNIAILGLGISSLIGGVLMMSITNNTNWAILACFGIFSIAISFNNESK